MLKGNLVIFCMTSAACGMIQLLNLTNEFLWIVDLLRKRRVLRFVDFQNKLYYREGERKGEGGVKMVNFPLRTL